MTEPFDWTGLVQELRIALYPDRHLRERIEAGIADAKWFVKHTDTINTIVQLGMARDEATARAEADEARVKALEAALRELRSYGCPVCNGDCGSANPPVISCPMQSISATLGGEHDK